MQNSTGIVRVVCRGNGACWRRTLRYLSQRLCAIFVKCKANVILLIVTMGLTFPPVSSNVVKWVNHSSFPFSLL